MTEQTASEDTEPIRDEDDPEVSARIRRAARRGEIT